MLMVDDYRPAPPPRTAKKEKRGRSRLSLAEERMEQTIRIYTSGPLRLTTPPSSLRQQSIQQQQNSLFCGSVCSRVSGYPGESPVPIHIPTTSPHTAAEAPAPARGDSRLAVTASAFRKYMDDMDAQLNDALEGLGDFDEDLDKRFEAVKAKHDPLRRETRRLRETLRRGGSGPSDIIKRLQGLLEEAQDSTKKQRARAQKAEQATREQREVAAKALASAAEWREAATKAHKVAKDQREAAKRAQQAAKDEREATRKVQDDLNEQREMANKRLKQQQQQQQQEDERAAPPQPEERSLALRPQLEAQVKEAEARAERAEAATAQQSELVEQLRGELKKKEFRLSAALGEEARIKALLGEHERREKEAVDALEQVRIEMADGRGAADLLTKRTKLIEAENARLATQLNLVSDARDLAVQRAEGLEAKLQEKLQVVSPRMRSSLTASSLMDTTAIDGTTETAPQSPKTLIKAARAADENRAKLDEAAAKLRSAAAQRLIDVTAAIEERQHGHEDGGIDQAAYEEVRHMSRVALEAEVVCARERLDAEVLCGAQSSVGRVNVERLDAHLAEIEASHALERQERLKLQNRLATLTKLWDVEQKRASLLEAKLCRRNDGAKFLFSDDAACKLQSRYRGNTVRRGTGKRFVPTTMASRAIVIDARFEDGACQHDDQVRPSGVLWPSRASGKPSQRPTLGALLEPDHAKPIAFKLAARIARAAIRGAQTARMDAMQAQKNSH